MSTTTSGAVAPSDAWALAGLDTEDEARSGDAPAPSKPSIPIFDRLPPPKSGVFGLPPRASFYHTHRAENARQRAWEQLPDDLAHAESLLIAKGLKRARNDVADFADHNVMTLAYGLAYARCGLTVIDSHAIDPVTGAGTSWPSKEAKVPLGAGWQNRATNDSETIVKFWSGDGKYPPTKKGKVRRFRSIQHPRNVSIVLPYGCGLFVLDIDGAEGKAQLAALIAEHGDLPATVKSVTGSGGWHFIFRTSRPIRNTASKIVPKVDIRGEGGQIIAAPSIHKTGNFYRWEDACAPWECDIADAPEWLERLAFEATATNSTKVKAERRAARTADSGTRTPRAYGHGFYFWCGRIGDDGDGFDGPIRDAALAWWRVNPDGEEEELFDTLRDVITDAQRDPAKDRSRYDTDDYLAERIAGARAYIEERRAAEEEAEREESEFIEAARAYLREHLVTEVGETTIAADAAPAAIAMLEAKGALHEDAAYCVEEAAADVLRQLESRAEDRQRDPVTEAKAELAEAGRPTILAALYDERLVDDAGFMVRPDAAPGLYREYKIKPKDSDAETRMRLEVRDQMFAALNVRVSWVVLDGEAKWAIRGGDGEAVRLWKEATISKIFINRGVSYWEGEGDKAKTIKPSDVITYARQRDTFLDTCFEPDPAKAAIAARRGQYNLWSGFAVSPVKGDWSLLRGHIRDQLCGGDEKLFNFVMTWLASLFARPGVKVPSSIAVVGEQGTGKSKVFDWIRRAIGSAALKVSAGRHLTGNFNAHLDGKIFLTCEEAFWGGDKQAAGVLKDLITSETLQIEGKFVNVVERPNYVNAVFISNNAWVIPTDGEDARRFLVLHCLPTKKQNAPFFGQIDDQMEAGGLAAMVHELMHWKPEAVRLTWSDLRNPPVTEGLRQQAGMGLNGPAARLVSILESGFLSGRVKDGTAFYYALSDTVATDVVRHHLVAALMPDSDRGNLTRECKAAIDRFLGEDADGGDAKRVINYLGGLRRVDEDDDDARDDTSLRIAMKTTARFVTIPALSSLSATLARYGRG